MLFARILLWINAGEFRAFNIWKHAALAAYKYMMWIDADALVSKTWENDPMEVSASFFIYVLFDTHILERYH